MILNNAVFLKLRKCIQYLLDEGRNRETVPLKSEQIPVIVISRQEKAGFSLAFLSQTDRG